MTGLSTPEGVAVLPDGSYVYVANFGSMDVSVIRTSDNTIVATVAVGVDPKGVAVTPVTGSDVYVANSFNGTVSVIRTSDNTVVATVTVSLAPVGVAVTLDGSEVYVTNNGSTTVSVIRTSDNTVIATVTGLSNPVGIAITPCPPQGGFRSEKELRKQPKAKLHPRPAPTRKLKKKL